MKKVVLTVAAIFAFGFANAQDKKDASGFGFTSGDVFIEGVGTFDSTKNKNTDQKSTAYTIMPRVGYFLSDNFAVGAELSVGSTKTENSPIGDEETSTFGAGVFGRYYFLNLGERFKTYTQLGVNFGSAKDEIADTKATYLNAGVGLGINYFVTPKLAISFGLSDVLSYTSDKADGDEAITGIHAKVNVFNNFFDTPTFGLLYKL